MADLVLVPLHSVDKVANMQHKFIYTRTLKNKQDFLDQGWEHSTILAPSSNLLGVYLKAKADGRWNIPTFQKEYLPSFLQEMKSQKCLNEFNRIANIIKSGESVALSCHCHNYKICHLSILAQVIGGLAQCKVRVLGYD